MKITKLLIMFALITTNALARIGETQADVEQRLGSGKPLSARQERYSYPLSKLPADSPQCRSIAYEYQTFLIVVSYFNGKSASEIYVQLSGNRLTDEQRLQLMENNSSGHQWKVNAPDIWVLGDQHVRAILLREPPGMWIVTEPFLDYKMAQDRKGLKGM